MKNILKSLLSAKVEIMPLVKDSTNPHFKSKYFDINSLLENIEPILFKHGLMVLQPIIDNKIKTIIYHVESGESIESILELPNISEPQKIGGAITYYRRYTLQSLLSLQAEDDDANGVNQAVRDSTNKPKQSNNPLLPELVIQSKQFNELISKISAETVKGETLIKAKKYFTIKPELLSILETYQK